MLSQFKQLFWRPPRAHGEQIEDRSVGFIELFYDLVYVVVIAQATHHLAAHLSWRGFFEFVVIFGMIWIAWMNGTLYHDLHGGNDGRSRTFIFLQMLILALLGVFTGDAAGATGVGFALTYTAFLVVLTWLWYSVRRIDSDEYSTVTARYLAGMALSVALIGASAFLSADLRFIVWAVFIVLTAAGLLLFGRQADASINTVGVTDSTVERVGLFTIIVLGEVVVGVVTGLSEVERTIEATATGMIGLVIGFGIWWTYFDLVGQRKPRAERNGTPVWMFSHFPVSLGIAASGAALVSLVQHAGDARTPAASAWTLVGSVAIALLFLVMTIQTLADFNRFPSIYKPTRIALVAGAGAVLLAGWWRPQPWLLALTVVLILSAVWMRAVTRWVRLDDPQSAMPG